MCCLFRHKAAIYRADYIINYLLLTVQNNTKQHIYSMLQSCSVYGIKLSFLLLYTYIEKNVVEYKTSNVHVRIKWVSQCRCLLTCSSLMISKTLMRFNPEKFRNLFCYCSARLCKICKILHVVPSNLRGNCN